jgi:hypothetical protein
MKEDPAVFKRQKKALKDIEPVKDILSELSEEEPKDIGDIKKRLTKK